MILFRQICVVYGDKYIDLLSKIAMPSLLKSIENCNSKNKYQIKFTFITDKKSEKSLEAILSKFSITYEIKNTEKINIYKVANLLGRDSTQCLGRKITHKDLWDLELIASQNCYVNLFWPDQLYSGSYFSKLSQDIEHNDYVTVYGRYVSLEALTSNEALETIQRKISANSITEDFLERLFADFLHPIYLSFWEHPDCWVGNFHNEIQLVEHENTLYLNINSAHASCFNYKKNSASELRVLFQANRNWKSKTIIDSSLSLDSNANQFPMIYFASMYPELRRCFKIYNMYKNRGIFDNPTKLGKYRIFNNAIVTHGKKSEFEEIFNHFENSSTQQETNLFYFLLEKNYSVNTGSYLFTSQNFSSNTKQIHYKGRKGFKWLLRKFYEHNFLDIVCRVIGHILNKATFLHPAVKKVVSYWDEKNKSIEIRQTYDEALIIYFYSKAFSSVKLKYGKKTQLYLKSKKQNLNSSQMEKLISEKTKKLKLKHVQQSNRNSNPESGSQLFEYIQKIENNFFKSHYH